MKRFVFVILLLAFCLPALFAEEKSKTVVYKEGDVQYSKIEKEVFWYNEDAKLIKVETYFNANGLEETGLDL